MDSPSSNPQDRTNPHAPRPIPMAWLNPGKDSKAKRMLRHEKYRKERIQYLVKEAAQRRTQSPVQYGQSTHGEVSSATPNSKQQQSAPSNPRDLDLERRLKFQEEQAKTSHEAKHKIDAFKMKHAKPRDTQRGSRDVSVNDTIATNVRNRRR